MKRFQGSVVLVCLIVLAGCGGGNSGSGRPAPPVLQSIIVTPATPSVAAGLSQQFTATGHYSDNTTRDLTNSATWTSSNTNAATIASGGKATTKTAGSTTITAADSGISGSTSLTVSAAVVASITVSPASTSISLGTTAQFTASATLTDGTKQDVTNSATWASSDLSVASISSSGLANSHATGSVSITASASGITGTASLTVNGPGLVSIAVTPPTASVAQNTTVQYTATGTYTDGSSQNITSSVTWVSSNPAVASINLNGAPGLAKAITAGTTIISATSGNVSGTASLTVTSAFLVSIVVTPVNVSIPLGTVQQFTATGTFSDNTKQDITGSVTWSSSDNTIVSITVSGLGTGRDLGSVTITATSGSVNGTATASVNAADLSSISIQPGDIAIPQLTSQQFSAIGTFTDGSTQDLTAQCSWTSSDTNVAKVSGVGLAKGLTPGTATITATLGGVSNAVTLTVTNATIVSISLTPAGRTIPPFTRLSFTATGTFSDSSTHTVNRESTWASDNTAVATVSGLGVATGVSAGTTNISATFSGVSGSTALTVSSATLTSIAVTPATAVLAPASTLGYTATGTFSDGTTQNISTAATWTSSAPAVATVSNFGLVTGQSGGAATITAQLGSVSGSAHLVVDAAPLTAVQVTPATATVAEQTGILFHATGVFGDGSTLDLTNSASWTSSSPSVATVSNSTSGLATGVAPGQATISALFAGQVGSAKLTVTNATMTSITVTPASADIALGNSQAFTATGNFSDGTTENLTTQVAWSSSDVNVATIGQSGLAISAGTGTTTITATMNGVTGTAVLTVH
jgi:trimeric autotransporter adhesin